jgi:hypothetical protein
MLAMVLAQFPFVIHGFHSDNGSEFINQTVARLLNKLLIEQTKSCPRSPTIWKVRIRLCHRPVRLLTPA